jgi:hypothetical protein
METLQITMTDEVKAFLQTQATKNGLASPRDYVQSVLAELATRVQEKKELEASLLDAIRSPHVVADAAFWAERRKKILDKHPELA